MTDHKKPLAAAAAMGLHAAVREYQAQHPDAARLKINATVIAYKARTKEERRTALRAVAMFLSSPASLKMSNAEIVQRLVRDFGIRVPPNILTEKLKRHQLSDIKSLLQSKGFDLDLSVLNTPSKIKGALKAGSAASKAPIVFKGTVCFTDAAIIVGDRAFPIRSDNGKSRIRVGEHKVSLAALREMLGVCGK